MPPTSTLQFQLNPKLQCVWTHIRYDEPPTIDAADNVDGDFDERATNKEGYVAYGNLEPRKAFVLIRANGYEPVMLEQQLPHNELITVDLVPTGGSTQQDVQAGGAEHGFLQTRGQEFVDETGQLWPFAGYATHLIMCRIKKGEDVGPIFDEAKSYGANTLIPICCHLSPWKRDNGFLLDPREPGWQELLAATCDLAAAKGMRLAPACFADTQYGMSDDGRRRVWAMYTEVIKGRWNLFGRIGNEAGDNGYHSGDFDRPGDTGGVLYSRGSEGQNRPPNNGYWDFAEWEGRTGPPHKAFDDAGAGVLELNNGYVGNEGQIGPFRCPIVVIENPVFNEVSPDRWGDHRWTEPADALKLGLENGANAAGGGMGTTRSLEGQPNGPKDAESCRRYYFGLRRSFLR